MVLLDWPPPDHLWIGTKSRQFLPSQPCSSMTFGRARTPSRVSPRRSSNANGLCGQNSAGSGESVRLSKGIFCDDVSEFESYMPSHAVWSPPLDSALSQCAHLGQKTAH